MTATIQKNPQLTQLLKEIELKCEAKRKADDNTYPASYQLNSMLLAPLLHFLSYFELLRCILEETPQTHPDYSKLKEAYESNEKIKSKFTAKEFQIDDDSAEVHKIVKRMEELGGNLI